MGEAVITSVIGMHRSGTSLLASMLAMCGIYPGPEDQLMHSTVKEDNPYGYWEYLPFVDINNDLLTLLGGRWNSPPPIYEHWTSIYNLQSFRERVQTHLDEDFAGEDLMLWKDPRTCLTIEFWIKMFQDLKPIIIVRNPLEVAFSTASGKAETRDLPVTQALSLWQTYHEVLLQTIRPENALWVHYDNLMQQPGVELERIIDYLAIDVEPSKIQNAISRIHPEQRTNQLALHFLPEEIARMYQSFCDLAEYELPQHKNIDAELLQVIISGDHRFANLLYRHRTQVSKLKGQRDAYAQEVAQHRANTEQKLNALREQHQREVQQLQQHNSAERERQLNALREQHQREVQQLQQRNSAEREQQLNALRQQHQREIEQLQNLNLAEREQQLNALRQQHQHETQQLQQQINADREQHQLEVVRLESEKSAVEEQVAQVQSKIEELQQQLFIQRRQHSATKQQLARREQTLAYIHDTRGYRALLGFWNFRQRFLPPGSRRERTYYLVRTATGTLLKGGLLALVNRGYKWLRGERRYYNRNVFDEVDEVEETRSLPETTKVDTSNSNQVIKQRQPIKTAKYFEFDTESEKEFLARLQAQGFIGKAFEEKHHFSIILPTRDRRLLVLNAIRSVLNQTYPYWELIIIDDGSSDGTQNAIETTFDDERITLIRTAGVGVSTARNLGLDRAKHKFIAYLDSDNTWVNNFLEFMMASLMLFDADMVYSAIHAHVDKDNSFYRGRDFDYRRLLKGNYIDLNSFVHKAYLYKQLGGFDETLPRMVDWELLLRYCKDVPAHYVPVIGVNYDASPREDRITRREAEHYKYAILNNYLIDWDQLWQTRYTRTKGLVSIIIPVFNQIDLTEACLQALLQVEAQIPFEIVVVDNGSDSTTNQRLKTWASAYEEVHLIRNHENLNFALGCNIGVAHSHGEFIVLLNNDTEVLKGWLSPLIQPMLEHQDVGIVSPKLLYPDDTIQYAGLAFNDLSMIPYHIYAGFTRRHIAVNKPRFLQAATGACMAFRAEDYIQLRGFDTSYINGAEDLDICFRLRTKLKKRIYYNPDSEIYHYEGKTEGRSKNIQYNRRLFVKTWGNAVQPDDQTMFATDGITVVRYEKKGAEEHSNTAIYTPVLQNDFNTGDVQPNYRSIRTFNIGISTIWHVRGISLVVQQVAQSLESDEIKTHIFARWESDKFQNSGAIYHPRVYNGGDDPPTDEILHWVRENKIDFMIFAEIHPKDWKRVRALKQAGVPVMCYEHLDILRKEHWDDYGVFDYFLFHTFYAREVFTERFPHIPSLTIPWGVIPPPNIEAGGVETDHPLRFVHVAGWGGINLRKNSDLVIRAFHEAQPPNAELHFYTQCPLVDYGDDVVSIASSNAAIHIYEGTYSNIFEAYHNKDVLLWPSKREGLGLPIVEALACGLPVLVTDGYMMKQWMIPGRHGLLVAADPMHGQMFLPEMQVDQAHLASQILDLSTNREWIKQIAHSVEKDRKVWIWSWQADVLREQLLKIVQDPSYRPSEALDYLPDYIRHFEHQRQEAREIQPSLDGMDDTYYCPVCSSRLSEFSPAGRNRGRKARCGNCGSLERHRLIWLYIQQKTDLLRNLPQRILHFAPSEVLMRQLKELHQESYEMADLYPFKPEMIKLDITNVEKPDSRYDAILCSHVLEHISEDQKAMRELYRILKSGGWALIVVPSRGEETFEDWTITSPEDREKTFGQNDHVRWYGTDIQDRLRNAGFTVTPVSVTDLVSEHEIEKFGLVTGNDKMYFCQKLH